ncbi:MAG: chemotaxis protein CheA [Nevskiales bacterium]|nr:chemotaxis protein CheA [Nevskiales bacterium]
MTPFEETFRQETADLLEDLEAALLEMEDAPDDMSLVDRAFRAMHTIKGSGAMFGFDAVSSFTHHLEDAFDQVRRGELSISQELISIGLDSRDHIRTLIDTNAEHPDTAGLLNRLSAVTQTGGAVASAAPSEPPPADAPQAEPSKTCYQIKIRPSADTFMTGTNPLNLLRELGELGDMRLQTSTARTPNLDELDPEQLLVDWDIELLSEQTRNAIDDVFLFVSFDWDINIEVRAAASESTPGPAAEAPAATPTATATAEPAAVPVPTAAKPDNSPKPVDKPAAAAPPQETVKVPAERLDHLINVVGELVISQARLLDLTARRSDEELLGIAEELERLTNDLRDTAINIRMLPIGSTFARFRRLVRDLSTELCKDIKLVTEGAETELDKTVIDKLGDPLVHLIRNSLDHGVESPDEREAVGKPRTGQITLTAQHRGSHVLIEVRDDGKGLDAEKLRAKGIERGLIKADAQLSEQECYELIFQAGFSTAQTISNISGRGVGMDVVKRSIEALRGTLNISSELGVGTTIHIQLPLTLAIIEGLLVELGPDRFVIPLSAVEECLEISDADAQGLFGLVELREQLLPRVALRHWFEIGGPRPETHQVVIARSGDDRVGFVVDAVIGQHQTVIKSVGHVYEDVEGLAGATILGDGSVALILDISQLAIVMAQHRQANAQGNSLQYTSTVH